MALARTKPFAMLTRTHQRQVPFLQRYFILVLEIMALIKNAIKLFHKQANCHRCISSLSHIMCFFLLLHFTFNFFPPFLFEVFGIIYFLIGKISRGSLCCWHFSHLSDMTKKNVCLDIFC